MKGTDVKCPVCGTVNKSLFLEETDGYYECEGCGYYGKAEGSFRKRPGTRSGDIEKDQERLTPLMA